MFGGAVIIFHESLKKPEAFLLDQKGRAVSACFFTENACAAEQSLILA